MGANQFIQQASGKTADEAFENAVEEAEYQYGHSGYTGTIAEKDRFNLIDVPEGEKPEDFANRLLDEDDERIDDKWGPAGAVQLSPPNKDGITSFLFFGWASS